MCKNILSVKWVFSAICEKFYKLFSIWKTLNLWVYCGQHENRNIILNTSFIYAYKKQVLQYVRLFPTNRNCIFQKYFDDESKYVMLAKTLLIFKNYQVYLSKRWFLDKDKGYKTCVATGQSHLNSIYSQNEI